MLLAAALVSTQVIGGLANVSTRAFVGAGAEVMIPGIIVNEKTDRYLIGVAGPSLSGSLLNFLADPALQVINQQTGAVVAESDNWQMGPSASELAALNIALHPNEPAVVVDLSPGSYTVIVTGAGGSTGVAVAGVYEINAFWNGAPSGITPGTWRSAFGKGRVCFNVSADGTSLTAENSVCDSGRSLDIDVDGACDIEIELTQNIPINNNEFSYDGGNEQAKGTFTSNTAANGTALDTDEGVCSTSWSAGPAN
ncbi:MAG: hypothetical protein U9Q81_21055 [Pseudomonadota bacterium]|nr:hypothetical protein [Pseudomonadota bacterium]